MKNIYDKKIIMIMERLTGDKNGIVTRDDEDNPLTYESPKDNGFVYLIEKVYKNTIDFYKLQ